MKKIAHFLKKYWPTIAIIAVVMAIVGLVEYHSGRLPLGPDGKFGWWDGNVWGDENSQRLTDAYSFSHVIHGILFYAFFWLIVRIMPARLRERFPLRYRLLAAVVIEAAWEICENSSFVIDRYRSATIAIGYVGDSIMNSLADIVCMMVGFLIARISKIWVSIALIIVLEVGCLFWIRDNLTLNVLMLVYPVESVKVWQSVGH